MDSCNTSGEKQMDRVYRGVRRRSWGKWVSEIRKPGTKTRIWLGSYDHPHMAARAYDVAAVSLKGKLALPNFPDLVHTLPRPASLDPRDIQLAAAEAALSFTDYSHVTTSQERFPHFHAFCFNPPAAEAAAFGVGGDCEMIDRNDSIILEQTTPPNCMIDEECGREVGGLRRIRTERLQLDEELPLFESPNLVMNLAEALLLSPPRFEEFGYHGNDYIDDGYYFEPPELGFLWSDC
ncbi:hypothetical protein SUGI_0906530 [Cryptomeria japonica]|uniref:ethylene-responsive transcription factor ERF024-like n=1 Tax=Cryptomeria japonica TaxID=3369 RepID=UPI00241495CA|nr:ethylene-responsive transcription factor ERF024-like [Cryptomeria japonica]GLJ43566.1 hypothetical protein SUGI_0906530 [Cryptomeria japonica]